MGALYQDTNSSDKYCDPPRHLGTEDWFGMVNMRIQRPSRRSVLTALNDWEAPDTCINLVCCYGDSVAGAGVPTDYAIRT